MTEIKQPIARVIPLLGMPHLDRLFDYTVPPQCDSTAQPGVRVRVRFAGRLVDALIIERRRTSDHGGSLRPLERVISPIVVCPPHMWRLVTTLARRYAGNRSDILRTALPPRHASAEKAGLFGGGKAWENLYGSLVSKEELAEAAYFDATSVLENYSYGTGFLSAVLEGKAVRASWISLPGSEPHYDAAALAAATMWNGGDSGVLILAPNHKEVERVSHHLRRWVSGAQITQLTAQESPAVRYRRFLSIVEGQARLVVGTRSAVLAPVKNLRLIVVLGEADDNLVDPRAPYINARDVAKLRSEQENTAFVTIGVHRCAEVQQWIADGSVHSITSPRNTVMDMLPIIRALGETDLQREREAYSRGARIPALAFTAIRTALDRQRPVLVQVPRRGYAPALACSSCRSPARCRYCNGPLELPHSAEAAAPRCRWCGATAGLFTCTTCGNHSVRMSVVGQDRTAEELGKAFNGVPIIASGGNHVRESIPQKAAIIVATPGAEPLVEADDALSPMGHYGAAVLLDLWILLGREDLRAQENAVRQWMRAASLVCPHSEGGVVVLTADASLTPVQQVIRWDPVAAAQAELASRTQAHFPPAASVAAIDGTQESIAQLMEYWEVPAGAELLGPVELPAGVRLPAGLDRPDAHLARRMIVRVHHSLAEELGGSLKQAQAIRATSKLAGPLRIVMDPVRIG
ncbi:primosomal protein N' [Corynebacterium anserum]|uniref:primosomal protein N' n=1 Tax=Corynebacterium anserum TaxID=2684406 RepID=UPI0031B5998C